MVMSGKRITAIRLEDGSIIKGKMFIDASYEGDLLPLAGVSFMMGRESNSEYGETGNGITGPRRGKIVPAEPCSGFAKLLPIPSVVRFSALSSPVSRTIGTNVSPSSDRRDRFVVPDFMVAIGGGRGARDVGKVPHIAA